MSSASKEENVEEKKSSLAYQIGVLLLMLVVILIYPLLVRETVALVGYEMPLTLKSYGGMLGTMLLLHFWFR